MSARSVGLVVLLLLMAALSHATGQRLAEGQPYVYQCYTDMECEQEEAQILAWSMNPPASNQHTYDNLPPFPYASEYETAPDSRGNRGFNEELFERDRNQYYDDKERDERLPKLEERS